MTTNDDMREHLQRLETKVDGLGNRVDGLDTKVSQLDTKVSQLDTKLSELATKVDQLPTKADFAKMTDKVSVLVDEAKDDAKKAAEGYGATLERIERDLRKMNNRVRTRLSDHDKVLANHNNRLIALEPPRDQ